MTNPADFADFDELADLDEQFRIADAPDALRGNVGTLSAVVWPPYAGLADTTGTEPYGDRDYSRAMIAWRRRADGDILGFARVFAPKGTYTHILYWAGPQPDATLMGAVAFEHALVFDRSGAIDLDPIANQDYLPRETARAPATPTGHITHLRRT